MKKIQAQGERVIQGTYEGQSTTGRAPLRAHVAALRFNTRTSPFAVSISDLSAEASARLWVRRLLFLSMVLVLCACASLGNRTSTKEEKAMPDGRTEIERPHDAPELLRRLLALIDSVHQPQDLSVAEV